eukprot:scaffold8050_cov116-Cylindrotheca_fusiformis.AAC.11
MLLLFGWRVSPHHTRLLRVHSTILAASMTGGRRKMMDISAATRSVFQMIIIRPSPRSHFCATTMMAREIHHLA